MTSLESLKPIRTLLDIAKKYGGDPDVLRRPEVLEYLNTYGDRSPCELKLEAMTYREDPSLLERKIREYASDPEKLDRMIANLAGSDAPQGKISFVARRARLGIMNRETSRLNRGRVYGMVRRLFLQIGEILRRDGHLDSNLDIFYLTIDEIEGGAYGSYKETVAARKAEYAEYEKLPAHTRLVFRGDTLIDEKIAANWTGSFTGIGTSMGSVTAPAVVLESPNEQVDVKGKIIVTKTTDPGWVFLMTMAEGIVAEKGSLLSHTAIVSRELGIPAVVAVDSATAVIKTGDVIRIDGDAGTVEIVQAA
jgi:pyruvate,water dikinase